MLCDIFIMPGVLDKYRWAARVYVKLFIYKCNIRLVNANDIVLFIIIYTTGFKLKQIVSVHCILVRVIVFTDASNSQLCYTPATRAYIIIILCIHTANGRACHRCRRPLTIAKYDNTIVIS